VILLDTDIAVDILRKHPPAMAWIASVKDPVCLPGIAALELYQGCYNKKDVAELERQIKPFAILWPSDNACNTALATYAQAHLSNALGLLDALIAATALAHTVPLHTFNQKHFIAVPGLQTIQPYVR
jgi:predicted nucleic acid-binding protein